MKFYFIGNNHFTLLARLSGGQAIRLDSSHHWLQTFSYLKQNKQDIGAICLDKDPQQIHPQAEFQLNSLNIPYIILDLKSKSDNTHRLSKLMESALGMKLSEGSHSEIKH